MNLDAQRDARPARILYRARICCAIDVESLEMFHDCHTLHDNVSDLGTSSHGTTARSIELMSPLPPPDLRSLAGSTVRSLHIDQSLLFLTCMEPRTSAQSCTATVRNIFMTGTRQLSSDTIGTDAHS